MWPKKAKIKIEMRNGKWKKTVTNEHVMKFTQMLMLMELLVVLLLLLPPMLPLYALQAI